MAYNSYVQITDLSDLQNSDYDHFIVENAEHSRYLYYQRSHGSRAVTSTSSTSSRNRITFEYYSNNGSYYIKNQNQVYVFLANNSTRVYEYNQNHWQSSY